MLLLVAVSAASFWKEFKQFCLFCLLQIICCSRAISHNCHVCDCWLKTCISENVYVRL